MRRLLPVTLAALLIPAGAALAKPVSVKAPAEAQTAITVIKGAKAVSVKSAPKGVIVLGSAARGRAAIAVARPRGAAAGAVVLNVKGGARKAAAKAACNDLPKLLARRLSGPGAPGLGAVLAARACGKPDPAGAAGLLAALGLGPAPGGGGGGAPAPAPAPAQSGGSLQRPPAPPGGGGGGAPSVPSVAAACAASSGIAQGDDQKSLFVGINSGCPAFTQVTVEVGATVASCEAITAAHDFTCGAVNGKAVAKGGTADMIDMPVTLTAPANCAVDAKVTFTLTDGKAQQLVEPIAGCGLIAVTPQCANGIDDDGDGMTDARDAQGATDPDPGCSGPGDTTESSDGDVLEGCQFEAGLVGGDPRYVYAAVANCGAIEGVWFKPPGTPADCRYLIGDSDVFTCPVVGRTAGATFAPTTEQVVVAAHLTADAACGPVTIAITLAGGGVMTVRGDWCGGSEGFARARRSAAVPARPR